MRNALLRSFAVRVKGLSICLLVTLVFATAVAAQTQITSGTIQGTVLDANGAAVPGASVEVKNVDTNFSRSLTTDEDGRFVALSVYRPAGTPSRLRSKASPLWCLRRPTSRWARR